MPRRQRRLAIGLALVLTLVLPPEPPAAVGLISDDEFADGAATGCDSPAVLIATVRVVGIPLTNSKVKLDGTGAKLADKCGDMHTIPSQSWRLTTKPVGSAVTLNSTALTATLNLDKVGSYVAELVACPGGCTLQTSSGSQQIRAVAKAVTVNGVATFTPTPAITPPAPVQPTARRADFVGIFDDDSRRRACQAGGAEINAVTDPQWVTTTHWDGTPDYKTGEGLVVKSRIAEEDNPLNHASHDQNWNVKLDPASEGLLLPGRTALHSEWEGVSLPERARPTVGDRISMTGFWIFDCGHDPFNTEIHAPVGMAVHRARPVLVPASARFSFLGRPPESVGTNIMAPGVVTEVVFNRDPGDMAGCNTSGTDLHQPATATGGACIREPVPINRRYEFTMQLPKSPLTVARELTLPGQPVPLYTDITRPPRTFETADLNNGAVGPEPVLEEVKDANGVATALRVTIDLSNFTGSDYARRISAVWVYPDAANWGLHKWRVALKRLHVYDDLEPGGNDGDWKMFFNTTNVEKEWTKILDCDGCVDDDSDRSFGTMSTGGSLGPDLLAWPGQKLLVHTMGFDEDFAQSDDTGTVLAQLDQRAVPEIISHATPRNYDLVYSIGDMGGSQSTLLSGARDLRQAYTFRGEQVGTATSTAAPVPALAPAPVRGRVRFVTTGQGGPGATAEPAESYVRPEPEGIDEALGGPLPEPFVKAEELPIFEGELEERKWNTAPVGEFRRSMAKVRRDEPAELAGLIGAMRARVDALLAHPQMRVDMAQDLPVLKAYLPEDIWVKDFRPFMGIRAAVLDEDRHDSSWLPWGLAALAGAVVVAGTIMVVVRRRSSRRDAI